MKVAVLGLWHLGSVTAACTAAAGHDVTGWDPDPAVSRALRQGKAPIAEPGLDDLIAAQLAAGKLRFEEALEPAVSTADVVWIAFDTPVDEEDRADVESVLAEVRRAWPWLRDDAVVLVSSQLPVGSVRRLEQEQRGASRSQVSWACSPENLRLGNAIAAFTQPDRVVVGVRDDRARAVLESLLSPITTNIEWMSVESAEMTKHAINAFLALSVAFINEVAVLCEDAGADAKQVERGLKSERRIGPRAYLAPGGAFAGGTLARDVAFLEALGEQAGVRTPLMAGIRESNTFHRGWLARALASALGRLEGRRVAVWGLTYKPGTDTLRRSSSVELCQWLAAQGAEVVAYDPAIAALPETLRSSIRLAADPGEASDAADALVVATEWPEFRSVAVADVIGRMRGAVVCDPNRFLSATFGSDPAVHYITVGRPRS